MQARHYMGAVLAASEGSFGRPIGITVYQPQSLPVGKADLARAVLAWEVLRSLHEGLHGSGIMAQVRFCLSMQSKQHSHPQGFLPSKQALPSACQTQAGSPMSGRLRS